MYCEKCGNELNEKDQFCSKCGEKRSEIVSVDGSEIKSVGENHEGLIEKGKPHKLNVKVCIVLAIIIVLIVIIVIICFVYGNKSSKPQVTSTENTTVKTIATMDSDKNDESSSNIEEYVTDTVAYIGSRHVDFDSATDRYRVFFAFTDEYETPISTYGNADIKIVNDNSETVYEESIEFSESDFTEWTNLTWDDNHYMACLYIPRSDISKGTTQSGVLTLAVTCSDEDIRFDPYEIKIYSDLPIAETKVTLPELPLTLNEIDYKGNLKNQMTVNKIEYSKNESLSGEVSITIDLTVSLDKTTSNSSSYSHFSYKFYDSSNVVVDSGDVLNKPVSVGESTVSKIHIYNLIPGESYKLVLDDYK